MYFDSTKVFGAFSRYIQTTDAWTLPVTGLRVTGGAQITFITAAVLSTKTPFIMIPQTFYDQLSIPVVNAECDNLDSLPDISIILGSRLLTFTPEDYVIKVTKYYHFRMPTSICHNAFLPTSVNGMIIGTTMFKKFYVKFEFDTVNAVSTAPK